MDEWGELILDDEPFPVRGGIAVFNLASFPQKITFGDYSRESDDLLSTWVLADFSGGGQIYRLHEGVDQGRFWRGNLNLRYPYQTTLGRLVQSFTAGQTDNGWPLGDLAGTFYFAFNRNIHSWDETTEAFTDTLDDLTQHPVNTGIDWGYPDLGDTPVIWVPCGGNGYARYDGATVTMKTDATPVAFADWDDQLWCITHDGQLLFWDGGLDAWGFEARLDRRHTPRNLTGFWDAAGFPQLYVATDKGAYAYDRGSRKFYPTGIRTVHPQAGHGFAVWQEEGGIAATPGQPNQGNLYYTAGMGTRRFEVGAVVQSIGLNRDEGVPIEYRGYVTDLRGAPGELWALVRGQTGGAADDPGIDADTVGEDSPTYPRDAAYASLHFFTNSGWFEAWASPEPGGTPTKAFVSAADDALRIWWGYAGAAYSIELPTDEHVPRQGLRAGVDRFQLTGLLQTGRFDAQMLGFDKIASHIQLNIPTDPVGATATETIEVWYRVDAEGWTPLGVVSGTGRQVISFGDEGLAFEEIEFEVRFNRDPADNAKSPLLDSIVLHFLKNPHPAQSWRFSVPLDWGPTLWKGRYTGAGIKTQLDALLTKRGLVSLVHNGVRYRVRLSQVGGSDATGQDERGERIVSAVEVPLDHGDNLQEPL